MQTWFDAQLVQKLLDGTYLVLLSNLYTVDTGAVGDSRIRAKNLEWKKKQKPPIGNNWVVMGSEQYSRLVVPYYLQKEASHLHVTFVR